MGHSMGDAVIVVALAAAVLGYFYLKQRQRQARLELIHQERLIAMEKGIPLPELPLEPTVVPKVPNPYVPLLLGIVLAATGLGAMVALWLVLGGPNWSLPLPLTLIGVGLLLFHWLSVKPRLQ
jgi:sterol desaturase/sphingolipid hydroxylase (fatty acid hydroxylase superfamily)